MKSKFTRILSLALCFILVMGIFSACSNEDALTESSTEPSTTEPLTQAQPKTDYNRLTGIDNLSKDAKGKRPVAIMINNIKASLPQYGIYDADLMFECLVEGGITRMMAVFADYTKIPRVCSVRSCRYYFPILAQGLDAVYFCFGCNPTLGKAALEKTKIDYFDGSQNYDTLVFGRDPARLGKYSKEHTAYVEGEKVPEMLKKYKVRTNYKEAKDDYIFDFRDGKAVSKTECKDVRLNFSKSYYSTFTYDSKNKVYLKTHCGNPHMDSAVNKQLQYTNVFVLETDVSLYAGGPLVKINWKGGTGYYISYGTVQKIKWKKADYNSTIKVTNMKGEEIKVNKGNSYFGFVNKGEAVLPTA